MVEEKQLVEALSKGNILAFNELFEIYSSRLYKFGLKYFHVQAEAEEMVQDVFLKIWNNREKLKVEKSFNAYIFTIAFNQIRKHFKKKNSFTEMTEAILEHLEDHSTEQSITYQSVLDQVSEILNELPPKKKQIFEMSRFEGLSSKEIAAKLGLSPKTIDNQVSEVICYLKEKVQLKEIALLLFLFLFS